ncbi:3-oxoacyl-ACP synthase III family protein [Actinopolyspora mortivallis]|uniref:3-oxoacyl-ACP synthase III family protein n=1 Tax=Actinopolyspora mortivallis TaxID=33906 RepID=UPI00039E8352|nr:ketoacyl-ACP synthase III [Actinopolyspora mortivallis]
MRTPTGAGDSDAAVGIVGTGSYLPRRVVTNEEVGAAAGVSAEWIERKTAIRSRCWVEPGQATSDMALEAARAAVADAGIGVSEVSLVVVATSTPDSPQPPTACAVAAELGVVPGTPAFDVNAVCSGFVFALVAAERMIRAGSGYAVVVGADTYSPILDPTDRRTAVLFGDGAGAVVMGASAGRGVFASRLASFGEQRELIRVPAGGSRIPPSVESLEAGSHCFTMDGGAVRAFVAERVAPAVRSFVSEWFPRGARGTHFVPHQANGRLLEELAEKVGVGSERMHTTVRRCGNTGAASVPLTLDASARQGGFEGVETVLLAGFGGGMSLGLVLVDWSVGGR